MAKNGVTGDGHRNGAVKDLHKHIIQKQNNG